MTLWRRRHLNPETSFYHDERGVTLVEYAVALVLAVTVGVTTLTLLGGTVEDQMNAAEAEMR